MSENFSLEIISPDNTILKSEAIEVTIPSYEGQMGILKEHTPLITFLRPGLIIIKEKDSKKKYFVEEGIVEFSNNILLILTSTANSIENLKKDMIDKMIKNASANFENKEINDKEKYLLSHKIDTLKEISQ